MSNKEQLLELVDLFIQNEESLSEYYSVCNEKFTEYGETWVALSKCEKKHADIFQKLKIVIDENPADWQIGNFSPLAVKMMVDQTKINLEKLKNDLLVKNYALQYVRDIESSLIESNLSNAFKTDIVEWKKIFSEIQKDSQWHKQALIKIIQKEM